MCSRILFTSESVSEGHPDKICDQISDAILDAHLLLDPKAKVAIEAAISPGILFICGEVNTTHSVNYELIARNVLAEIGYTAQNGFDPFKAKVIVNVNRQSPEISLLVGDLNAGMGAGDQGMMFGYASDETQERIPLTLDLSHKLIEKLTELRKNRKIEWLRPDAKSQVTIEYEMQNGALIPLRVDTVIVSPQHDDTISMDNIRKIIEKEVIRAVIPEYLLKDTKIFILPCGKFVLGGPAADCGLTGRKIIVDTYGGFGCHGGGCFSGKDPSKVDRSGAYLGRWIAKSLVDSNICRRALIQISYAIGMADPVSIFVDTYGTGKFPDDKIVEIVRNNFDLRPGQIIKNLSLAEPIYKKTAVLGHFGRSDVPWEKSRIIEFNERDNL